MSSVASILLKNTQITKLVAPQVRFYPRWSHRRPKRVLTPEEYDEVEKLPQDKNPSKTLLDQNGGFKPNWERRKQSLETIKYSIKPPKNPEPLIATHQKSKVRSSTDMLETVIDDEGNFFYSKMKNNDVRVTTILTEIKSKKEKTKNDLILLEGKRLIKDALQSGCQLKYVLFSRKSDVEDLKGHLPKIGAKLYKMPYQEMQMWSDLSTTPGIMGIFKTPDAESFTPKESLPFCVICDNIREPGNLGTILRICAAVGCRRVILTKGCVNLWDSKVLRSSMGAHFKLCINKNLAWEKIEAIVGPQANFFIADNKVGEVSDEIPLMPYYGVDFRIPEEVVLVVGGETLGVSKDSYELALRTNGARLHIPLSNEIDSLNVGAALGVIAFEIKKQLTCK